MMNTHFTDEQIALCAEALNAGNTNNLPATLKDHLKQCDECANQVTFVAQIAEETNKVVQVKSTTKKLQPYYWLSAAAVVVFLVAFAFFQNKPIIENQELAKNSLLDTTSIETPITIVEQPKNPKQVEPVAKIIKPKNQQEPVITKSTDSDLLAYATHSEMEKLVDRFKTGAMRGDDVEVLTTVEYNAKLGKVLLQWKNESGQELIVEFFNNKGEKLYEETTTATSSNAQKLTNKGLYYWKLINEDFDLIFCGKIKVSE